MKKFSDYKETEVNDFTPYEKIELGGHILKILEVKIETIQGKNGPFEQLVLKFDMDDSDKQAGYYARRFKSDAEKDALAAKWKGYYKVYIPKDDGTEEDGKTKVSFKTFITCVEKSNEGYDWEKADWDEKTLVGKKFVGVFGIREFKNNEDKVIYFTECRFARSTQEDLEKISIPKVKLVDGTYVDYTDWEDMRDEREGKNSESAETTVIEDEDDLPF